MNLAELKKEVSHWQKILGIESWDLRFESNKGEREEEDGPLHLMSFYRHTFYDQAVFFYHPAVIGEGELPVDSIEYHFLDDEFIRYKIIHELLHGVLRDLMQVTETLDGYLHRDVLDQFNKRWSFTEEQTVDRLAKALCQHFK